MILYSWVKTAHLKGQWNFIVSKKRLAQKRTIPKIGSTPDNWSVLQFTPNRHSGGTKRRKNNERNNKHLVYCHCSSSRPSKSARGYCCRLQPKRCEDRHVYLRCVGKSYSRFEIRYFCLGEPGAEHLEPLPLSRLLLFEKYFSENAKFLLIFFVLCVIIFLLRRNDGIGRRAGLKIQW